MSSSILYKQKDLVVHLTLTWENVNYSFESTITGNKYVEHILHDR